MISLILPKKYNLVVFWIDWEQIKTRDFFCEIFHIGWNNSHFDSFHSWETLEVLKSNGDQNCFNKNSQIFQKLATFGQPWSLPWASRGLWI